MKLRFRDWWRGWSEADLASAHQKIAENMRPGAVTFLTERELRAFLATSVVFPS